MSIERAEAAVKRGGQVISGSRNMSFSQIYRQYGTVLIFVGICILASILSPTFLTEANLTNVLRQVVVVSLLACGVTFIIILGHIDVSLGSVLALCGVIAASVMAITASVILAVVAGVAVGILTGIVNGFVITFFRIPSFIMTLAMTTVARGAVLLYTGGSPVTGLGDFKVIGQGSLGPVRSPCSSSRSSSSFPGFFSTRPSSADTSMR
ncbi:ribose/xylose/arabinose/galactoside ABC-type transport system permease subunit [Rhizobium leguminosarum]|nr:ABC transporter permease [Rhizobium leguminosarum]MBB4466715.1 ribose/xylose/arabinose/galactoside ABC-type transport system permease subunit [Rhizobium leguminosarum]MBB4473080.1 ribose/xylose/arabinose/galactoside ABC-type transport system permease subunit [Rhizobium leguminosarum]